MPIVITQDILLGYTGGMPLYISTWEDFKILFPITVLNYN